MNIRPFGPHPGTSRVLASATVAAGITFKLTNTDENVRITVIGGTYSIMARIDSGVQNAGIATSNTDGVGDTPILPNTSLLLKKGAWPCFISLGQGPDGATSGGYIVVQSGSDGVA